MKFILTKDLRKPSIYEYISFYLIPLYIIVFLFIKPIRPYLFISSITVFIIGILESVLRYFYIKNLKFSLLLGSILGHSLILFFVFSKIYNPPLASHLFLLLAIITIYLLDPWPYVIIKKYFILIYCIIYICVYFTTYIYYERRNHSPQK